MFSLICGVVIGAALLYFGAFGKARTGTARSSLERISGAVLFLACGATLIWASVRELLNRPTGNTIIVVTTIATIVVFAGRVVLNWIKLRGSDSWPSTSAIVESIDVREVQTRSSHYFVAEVGYSYQVEGEYFAGRYSREFADESEAADYALSESGSAVVIRYNPGRPEISRLDASI